MRARGNCEYSPDIDLAFSSPADISAELLTALDESHTSYLFDVAHYESLEHEGLRGHIDRLGVVFFRV